MKEVEGNGGKREESKKIVFSKLLQERKERKRKKNKDKFPFKTFLPNVGGKGGKEKERKLKNN